MKSKTLVMLVTISFLSVFSTLSYAKPQCDSEGIQVTLRASANQLHSGNPVRYIDFANDARFEDVFIRMNDVGVSNSTVKKTWVQAIKQLCGTQAQNISTADFSSTQTLSGLSKVLGL